MGNPLPSPLFPVLYVFSRHSWAEPRILGHYQASDLSAVHCPARALCIPVMIQCFVSRPNIIAPLDNTGPFWEWQTAAALLGEHSPFVQCYSRMGRATDRGAMHKATSVLPLVCCSVGLPAPCQQLWECHRGQGPGRRQQGNRGRKTVRGEQRGKIPKTACRSFRAFLKEQGTAAQVCQGQLHQQLLVVTFQPFPECVLVLPEPSVQSSMAMSIPKSKESCWCGTGTTWDAGHKGGSVVPCKKLCEAIQFINVESYPWKYHWSLVNPNSLRKVWGLFLFFLQF